MVMSFPRSIVFLPAVLILLLLIIVGSCSDEADWERRAPSILAVPTPIPPELMYYIPDPEHGAECWLTANGNGISCLYNFRYDVTPTPNSFERRIYNGY